MPQLEVCLSTELLHLYNLENKNVVVIDIFRATSCMTTAFAHGIEAIIPVAKIEECKALQDKGLLAAAEREGLKVEGFDLDNSPFSYMNESLKGKTIAVTTTNGTQAITKSFNANKIYIGSFLNLDAVSQKLKGEKNDLVLVCSGWKGQFCLEDSLFAGALAQKLLGAYEITQDAALMTIDIYQNNKKDLLSFVKKASHVKRLANLNIIKDIEFCLQHSIYEVVPYFEQDKLITT